VFIADLEPDFIFTEEILLFKRRTAEVFNSYIQAYLQHVAIRF